MYVVRRLLCTIYIKIKSIAANEQRQHAKSVDGTAVMIVSSMYDQCNQLRNG
jgi:hypothetical protein